MTHHFADTTDTTAKKLTREHRVQRITFAAETDAALRCAVTARHCDIDTQSHTHTHTHTHTHADTRTPTTTIHSPLAKWL